MELEWLLLSGTLFLPQSLLKNSFSTGSVKMETTLLRLLLLVWTGLKLTVLCWVSSAYALQRRSRKAAPPSQGHRRRPGPWVPSPRHSGNWLRESSRCQERAGGLISVRYCCCSRTPLSTTPRALIGFTDWTNNWNEIISWIKYQTVVW